MRAWGVSEFKTMALANALVGPALEAMAAPEVPFDQQLAQVAAEAEFKRLYNFEHGEALTKELAEAWAEHKDKAMAHAKKGLVDDGGDYSFEITSKLGATEKDVEHHLPEELLDMLKRNKMWVLRRNAESNQYLFRIKYSDEAKRILSRLEKEQEHAAKKQRCTNTNIADEAITAAMALDKAKKKYASDNSTENATLVNNLYTVADQALTELGMAAIEAYEKHDDASTRLCAAYKRIHEDYNGGAVSSTNEALIKAIKRHLGMEERSDTEATAVAHNKTANAYYEAKRIYNENQTICNATAVIEAYEKMNNVRFDKFTQAKANYTADPTIENALAVNVAYDEALMTANAASLPKAMQLRTDGNGLDGFVIPKLLVGREVLFHLTPECNPTWAKVTAQDGNDDRLVLTTDLGNTTIKRAQVIDVRRTAEDSNQMLEEHEREEAAALVPPPALCRQPSVVM